MRVLVAVASRHGGTREIGEQVAGTLAAAGHDVTTQDPAEVADLTAYDAVVLGSAVYQAHWLPEARDFADRLADDLVGRPVWLLSSGIATQPAAAANSPHEIRDLADRLYARGHRSFAGRLDPSVLSPAEYAVIVAAHAKVGDRRDMVAVRAWAQTIAMELDVLEAGYSLTA